MILIIAEKPSLGRNIAAAIEEGGGQMRRAVGYLEGEGYLITWAFGHLFSLADIEDYAPRPDGSTRWSMDNIPCFPEEFIYQLKKGQDKRPDAGVQKQFEVIRSLCSRADVDTIVNAGDSDREGEIIVRTCIRKAEPKGKNIRRLWLPDQTPQTVRQALQEMKDDSEYDPLANEGFARTFIDWLYGVNLTRYATLKTGTLLRVGRVIIPIVKAIYDRDMAIRNFVPEKYWAVVSKAETDGEEIELVSKQKFPAQAQADAQALCDRYNKAETVVTGKKTKKTTLAPGKLFSLSTLQNLLGKKYKMPMEESLAIVQKLYEAGYLTYPRTNSEYLATAEKGRIKQILVQIAKIGYPVVFKDKKTIFDDKKIESHSALTPTVKIPDPARLSDRERMVYTAVFRRFAAVFCAEECLAEKTEITVNVGGMEEFTLKGTVILQQGWMKYDDGGQKDKTLPPLKKGDRIVTDFRPTEKETAPPRHYTIETLNNYLKNPFREEKAAAADREDDTEDYRAIFEGLELGTEATRTGIIDNARKSEYIQLKKDVYTILPRGEYLIRALERMNIGMDKYKTAEMGKALKRVYRGEMTVRESVRLAEEEIRQVFSAHSTAQPPETDTDDGFFGDKAGVCPLCGGTVRRTVFGYGCSNYKEKNCKFTINSTICGRVISLANVRLLLQTGRTAKIRGFISKNGKPFDAVLVLKDGRAQFEF